MINSILTSTKKMLGIEEGYTHFDPDIIMHINTVFFTLNQLGVGPDKPFMIEDKHTDWDEFINDGDIETVKTYMYLKVRSYFDPPQNGPHINAMNEQIKELECRMNYQVDPKD